MEEGQTLFDKALTDPMVIIQTRFFARVAAVSRPAHRLPYAEFAAHPILGALVSDCVWFWNRIIKQEQCLAHTFVTPLFDMTHLWNFIVAGRS